MNKNKPGEKLYLLVAVIVIGAVGYLTDIESVRAQDAPRWPPPTARKPVAVNNLHSAVDQTAAVLEGVVTDIQYDYTEEEGPWTRVILSDVQAHFGSAPPLVEIRHFGGPLPNGSLMIASEIPAFVKGYRYVVFLRNTAWNVSPVVGNLALRVETVDETEVLVNSDGQAVTEVSLGGVQVGTTLFGGINRDGTPPKNLGKSLSTLNHILLNRQSFLEALDVVMKLNGLSLTGTFYDRPAGEFQWRAQRTTPSTRHKASAGIPENRTDNAVPEVDTSQPNQ